MEHKDNKKPVFLSTFFKFKDSIEAKVKTMDLTITILITINVIMILGFFSYLIFR